MKRKHIPATKVGREKMRSSKKQQQDFLKHPKEVKPGDDLPEIPAAIMERPDSGYVNRRWVADYLGIHIDSVEYRIVNSPKFHPTKIRGRPLNNGSKNPVLRFWKADVIAMLPPFDTDAVKV